MANWNLPSLISSYTNFVLEVANRDIDCARWFSSAYTAATSISTGTIRWNNTNKNWEIWSGTVWGVLSSTYGISITGYATHLLGGNTTTLLGSIPYQSGVNTTTQLAPNTTATNKFLTQTGTGVNGAIPIWDVIVNADIPTYLTGKTYNALTLVAATTGFTIAGGTTSKTLTVSKTITLTASNDTSTLNILTGGTLGSAAFTNSTLYALLAAASNTFVGSLTASNLSGTNTGDEPASSTTVSGIVELATNAEAVTGTDTVRAVTPAGVAAAMAALFVPRNYLSGYNLSRANTTTITIAAGEASSSANTVLMTRAAISKNTSAWAVGTSAGGLDTGTIAADTWYYFYIIYRSDTGVVDAIMSLSSTSPALPTGYTHYRYIGAMQTNASSQWPQFIQTGREFYWVTPPLDITTAASGTIAVTAGLSVPSGRKMVVLVNATPQQVLYLSDLGTADLVPSVANGYSSVAVSAGGQAKITTNTLGQIRYRCSVNGTLYISTVGWTDLADTQ